jgi:hypothetical protein
MSAATVLDELVQERMDHLAERANEGLLTDEERAAYEALISATDFVSVLKLKARRQLSAPSRGKDAV